ncbi:hypothetical protein [Emticicia sp. BO119]|uniref:hypothetical protein n=1 Tax=Emticicia sp. BO119 TaxID=2757768 RepID=UPI0015EFF60B|nr:hypothetical protein [Emticicia sp. BO119]MBA4849052.1 hypothetical protein [Emticicia sp. BO119]
MKKTAIYLSILILLITKLCFAQSTSITPGGAELLNNTNSEVLTIPKLTNQSILAIQTPKAGSLVYDIDSKCIRVYNGAMWICLTDMGSIPFQLPQKLSTKIIGSSQTGPQTAGVIVINAVSVDNIGNFYLAGRISGCYSSPISVCSNYSSNLYPLATGIILKITSSGVFKWATTVTGLPITGPYPDNGFNSEVSDLIIKNDKLYLVGNYSKSISWQNNTIISNGDRDIFIAKMDTSKSLSWIKNIGGNLDEYSCNISMDENSNIIIAGAFKSNPLIINTGNSPISILNSGGYDIFITKFDTNGNLLSGTKIGGTNDDLPKSLIYESSNFYLTGTFIGNFAGGAYTFTSTGGKDIFIIKFNSTLSISGGNRIFGTSNNDEIIPYEIKYFNGRLYICGNYKGSINFGDKLINSTDFNSFLGSFYFSDSPLFINYLQTVSFSSSFSSITANNTDIFASGNYKNTAMTMGIPLQSQGSTDIILFKIGKEDNFNSNNYLFSGYTTYGTGAVETAFKTISYNGKVYIFGSGQFTLNSRQEFLYMWTY